MRSYRDEIRIYAKEDFDAHLINKNENIGFLKHETNIDGFLGIFSDGEIQTIKNRTGNCEIVERINEEVDDDEKMSDFYCEFIYANKDPEVIYGEGFRFVLDGDAINMKSDIYRNPDQEGDLYLINDNVSLRDVKRIEVDYALLHLFEGKNIDDLNIPLVIKNLV